MHKVNIIIGTAGITRTYTGYMSVYKTDLDNDRFLTLYNTDQVADGIKYYIQLDEILVIENDIL